MKSKGFPGCVMLLFGLVFLVPGLFLSGVYFLGYADWWRARGWEEVPCRIESAELRATQGDDSTTYKVEAVYSYHYQGRSHRGERVGFSSGSDNIGSHHRRVYRELSAHVAGPPEVGVAESRRPGPVFRCYVNPARPDEAVLYRGLRWEMQAFMAIFALTFPAVGACTVAGGCFMWWSGRRRKALREAHPGEPWHWRPDWVGGVVKESGGKWRAALYSYTLWAGAVILPLLAASAASGAFAADPQAWLLMIFPALWLVPAGMSMKKWRRQRAVGNARLEMTPFPVPPGAVLAGEVVFGRTVRTFSAAEATLSCERKTTTRRSGESSVSTETVWSRAEVIGSELIAADVAGSRLPVRFKLPSNGLESGTEEVEDGTEIRWKLQVKIPGTAVDASFDIPVFRVPGAQVFASDGPGDPLVEEHPGIDDLPGLVKRQRLVAEFDERGWPRLLRCPPLRERGLIVFLLIFNLVWTGAAVVLVVQDAPLVFKLVWPLSATVIWLVLVRLVLLDRTITLDEAGLRAESRLGPMRWRLDLAREQIVGFGCDSNMQSNGRAFYRVRVESVLGRKHTLVGGLSDLGAGEALVSALECWHKPKRG